MKHEIIVPDEGEIFDIELNENILKRNRDLAIENSLRLKENNVASFDIMGSIGSGKNCHWKRFGN